MELPALSNRRALTVGDFLAVLWIWKFRVAAVVILGGLLLLGASFLVTPQYRASVLMLPAEQQTQSSSAQSLLRQFGGIASAAGISVGGAGDQKEEGIAILKSRSFIEAFVKSHDLQPLIGGGRGWWPGSKEASVGNAYRRFSRKILRVEEDLRSGVVELSVTWKDRSVVADWANALYTELNKEMRDRAISQANKSIDFLEKELERTYIEGVRLAIYNLIEGQIGKVMLANVNEEFVFRRVDGAHVPEANEAVSPIRFLWALAGAVIGFLTVSLYAATRATGQGSSAGKGVRLPAP